MKKALINQTPNVPMKYSEVSDQAMNFLNENKIDYWVNNLAGENITFQDVTIEFIASGKEDLKSYFEGWKIAFSDKVGKCNNLIR